MKLSTPLVVAFALPALMALSGCGKRADAPAAPAAKSAVAAAAKAQAPKVYASVYDDPKRGVAANAYATAVKALLEQAPADSRDVRSRGASTQEREAFQALQAAKAQLGKTYGADTAAFSNAVAEVEARVVPQSDQQRFRMYVMRLSRASR